MSRRFLVLPVLLLAGCVGAEPAAEDACGAADYRALVGAPLAAVTLPADLGARIVRPDSAVTLDYRPDRLNIHVDRAGVIERVDCG